MSVATPQVSAPPSTDVESTEAQPRKTESGSIALAVVRVLLGFVFLWPFLDKSFGLGFATPRENAWANGGSPTSGFLGGVEGVLAGVFRSMAGQAWVDWTFMVGMLLVGTALILGIAMRPAAFGATLLMGALWLASIPLENNPLVDEHAMYAATAVALAASGAGKRWGLGRTWAAFVMARGWRWFT